jgi:hypothetical protein
METGVLVPLAAFAFVVLIVALLNFTAIHDRESRTREILSRSEMEHRARVAELDRELTRLRQGG